MVVCWLTVCCQSSTNRRRTDFLGELAVLQFYLKFSLVKYPGNDWKPPLVIFMLQAFVLLVIGLTTSVVVIWYSFLLPAILLYTTPWIVLHIATAHWLLINIVFHYFKAVFTSPGRALQVRPCNCRQQEEPAILIFRLLLHMHRMYVASINLFGLPLKMNGMHRTQFDRLCLDFLSLIIWSRMFWPSIMWILHKAQRWSRSVLMFDRCRLHSVTFHGENLCRIFADLQRSYKDKDPQRQGASKDP